MTPAARVALDLCLRAREKGHEVILSGLVRTRETPGLTELGAAADAERIPFRLLQQRYRYDPGLVGQMEMMFRRLKPELYVSHDTAGAVIAWLARFRPASMAHYIHEAQPGERLIESLWIGRRILKRADTILIEGEGQRSRLNSIKLKGDKILLAGKEVYWIDNLLQRAASGTK